MHRRPEGAASAVGAGPRPTAGRLADELCAALADHGYLVVRYDNRYVEQSTDFRDAPAPDLPAVLAGDLGSAYTLFDMAGNAVGLLDALALRSTHLVSASMAGAIVQPVAIEHPDRVRSLTSMMSTTGNVAVGQATPETMQALFSGPQAVTREEVVAQAVRAVAVVGSPGYPTREDEVADRAGRAFDRGYDPVRHPGAELLPIEGMGHNLPARCGP